MSLRKHTFLLKISASEKMKNGELLKLLKKQFEHKDVPTSVGKRVIVDAVHDAFHVFTHVSEASGHTHIALLVEPRDDVEETFDQAFASAKGILQKDKTWNTNDFTAIYNLLRNWGWVFEVVFPVKVSS